MKYLQQILAFLTIILLGNGIYGQTRFERASNFWNGTYLFGGINQSHFLNENYHANIKAGVIKQGVGFNLGLQYQINPFVFSLAYMNTGFEVEEIAQSSDDSKPIRFQGVQANLFLSLLPDNTSIIPFIGIGYHNFGLSLDEEKSLDDTSSYIRVNNFLLSLKLRARLGRVIIESFYNRSVLNKQDSINIYDYGISLLVPLKSY